MHSPSFNVPDVMAETYRQLRDEGYEPLMSAAPTEWVKGDPRTGPYLRFHHAGGEIEVTWRPMGKLMADGQQKWRWRHRENATAEELGRWLDGIVSYATVR